MFERVGVGQADDVASERGVLGFFPDLRCGGSGCRIDGR